MSHYNVNASVPKTLIAHLVRWVAETGQIGEGGADVLLAVLGLEKEPRTWMVASPNEEQRGEFTVHGFRNRDLRALLFPDEKDPQQQKRQAAKITRLIRLLRAHGLIQKISHTHRYQLTANGRTAITAVLAAQHANTKQLARLAA